MFLVRWRRSLFLHLCAWIKLVVEVEMFLLREKWEARSSGRASWNWGLTSPCFSPCYVAESVLWGLPINFGDFALHIYSFYTSFSSPPPMDVLEIGKEKVLWKLKNIFQNNNKFPFMITFINTQIWVCLCVHYMHACVCVFLEYRNVYLTHFGVSRANYSSTSHKVSSKYT